MLLRPLLSRVGLLLAALCLAPDARAATVDVDGDLSDWTDVLFTFQDGGGDQQKWVDLVQLSVTDDNESASDGNLYLGIEFADDFRFTSGSHDVDLVIYLDLDGDGLIGGPDDRIIEVTEGEITDGDGNALPGTVDLAVVDEFMEVGIPYSVLGLEYGSDDFNLYVSSDWHDKNDTKVDYSPNVDPDTGLPVFITYPGTDPVPLAVTLAELGASAGPGGVTVQWSTASERDNLGFHVYRVTRRGQWERLTESPVAGLGDSAIGRDYRFVDPAGRAGSRYVIEDLDVSGTITAHGPVRARWQRPRPGLMRRVKARRLRTQARRRARRVGAQTAVKLAVREWGLNLVPPESLVAAGLDARAIERRGIALRRAGGSVPVLVTEHGTLFVGTPERDRYADFEVVQARVGRGAAMDERAVSGACERPLAVLPTTVTAEEQRVYYIKSPTPDPFFWAQTFAGYPARLSFDVAAPAAGAAELTVHATGIASVHAASFVLNGHALGAVSWTGGELAPLRVSVPEGVLGASNDLRVALVPGAEFDLVSIDRVSVYYSRELVLDDGALAIEAEVGSCVAVRGAGPDPLVLDVTEAEQPQLLGGYAIDAAGAVRFADFAPAPGGVRRYLIASADGATRVPDVLGARSSRRLRARHHQADSLVITHPDFAAAAERLADHHRGQGLSAMVVSTDEAYDAFGFGRPGADPIGALLDAARERWRRAPAYVTLVGGSTVDSQGHLPESSPDFVPTPFYTTGGSGYEAASDAWYVSDASGAPWAAIGRLPVGSAAEADAVVDKVVRGHAELATPLGKLLLVADSYAGWGQTTDEFEQAATRLQNACASPALESELWFKSEHPNAAAELLNRAQAGVDVISYRGHGFMSGWSSSPLLLDSATAGAWNNPRPFVLLSWTCFDGAFVGPWGESLAASLVRNPQGGALLATASTTMADPWALEALAQQVLCRLTSGEATRVGDALREAKRHLAGGSAPLTDLLLTYGLLGDPSTRNPWAGAGGQ